MNASRAIDPRPAAGEGPAQVLHFLLLAIASAFYPVLLAIVILMLASPRPVPLLWGYLLGGAIMSIGIGILILYVLDDSDLLTGSSSKTASPVADIVLGSIALLTALALGMGWGPFHPERARRRAAAKEAKEPKDPWSGRLLARGSARIAILVGMALSLPSFYYLAALKQIEEQYQTTATALALILVFNVIQFALVEVPLVSFLVAPERTRTAVDSFNRWLRANARRLGVTVAAVIGAYLVIGGIIDLVT